MSRAEQYIGGFEAHRTDRLRIRRDHKTVWARDADPAPIPFFDNFLKQLLQFLAAYAKMDLET